MSRSYLQMVVRLPDELRHWLEGEAHRNQRSRNGEIVHRLEVSRQHQKTTTGPQA